MSNLFENLQMCKEYSEDLESLNEVMKCNSLYNSYLNKILSFIVNFL